MPILVFDDIVFGPINSRRLGSSLGINLLPMDHKLCNFDCIYCECGWNGSFDSKPKLNKKEDIFKALEDKLLELKSKDKLPDAITFSGNGEPTMHPDFLDIVKKVIELRDKYAKFTKICVLSNATLTHRKDIFEALKLVDKPMLKLDSAFDDTVKAIDQPLGNYTVKDTVEKLKAFNGNFILQTMFLKGVYNGEYINNTSDKEVNAWLDLIDEVNPSEITIYTIDRQTPAKGLHKLSETDLEIIAEKVRAKGYKVQVSA